MAALKTRAMRGLNPGWRPFCTQQQLLGSGSTCERENVAAVTWIGCTIEVPVVTVNEPEVVILGISRQMIEQVLETLRS